jgi:O-antigen/teichoic acid export membrane protein
MSAPAIAETLQESSLPATARTLTNLASVFSGEGLLRVANFAVAVVIARVYGSYVFGVYATALAYATVATMVADNGLQVAAVTTICAAPEGRNLFASRLYAAKGMLLVPVLMGAAILLSALHASPLVWVVAGLITLRTALQACCQLQVAILKAIDRMPAIAAVQSMHFIFLMAGILWVYRSGFAIQTLLEVLLAGQVLEMIAEFAWLRRSGIRVHGARMSDCLRLIRRATPVGISFTLAAILLRMDVIVLAWIASAATVGHFAAAQQVLVIVYVGSWLFGSVLLPELARLTSAPAAQEKLVAHWTRLLLVVLVPIAIVGAAIGPFAIRALYGEAFAEAGRPFAILFLATPFIFLNALYLNRAILGAASVYVTILAVAAGAGLVLDLSLGWAVGIAGIAMAALAREIVICIALRLATTPRAARVAA